MKHPLISIVTVNWNGKRFLKDCFESIKAQTFKDFEVIMVDNASEDDSIKFVRKNYPFVKIIRNEGNYGFAKGNNVGFKEAKGQWIFAVNNDTKLDKNFLREIAKAISSNKDKKLGSISPKVYLFDNSKIDTLGHLVTPYFYGKDCKDEKDKGKMIGPSGVAAVYNKTMLEDIKFENQYFDEDFFMYCEDLDLNMRAHLKGWNTVFCGDAIVYHIHSGSSKSQKRINYMGNRNIIWVITKNATAKDIVIHSPLFFLSQIAVILKYSVSMPILILKSKFDSLKSMKVMFKKRKHIQGNRVRSSIFV